jgi:hypothetical protein
MKPFLAIQKSVKGALFVFEHGLGDLINFLPVHREFCRQVKKRVKIAASYKRQFHLIDKDIISLNGNESLRSKFDFIYRVQYPDSTNSTPPIELHNESAKPYLCAYYELGMSDFTWTPYRMNNQWLDPKSKRIGVHLFGHTGMHRKFCPDVVAELIWNEILEIGYEPFEVHMVPKFANEYDKFDRGCNDYLSMINESNSLRYEEPDLKRMIEETGKCKFFVGIDSGPIYLASAMIGCDNIIGLVNLKRHDHFLPKHISMVNVVNYKKGSIKRIIKQKEGWL